MFVEGACKDICNIFLYRVISKQYAFGALGGGAGNF